MGNPLKGADPESLDEAALSPPDSENVPATDCSSSPPPPVTLAIVLVWSPCPRRLTSIPIRLSDLVDPLATGSLPSLQISLPLLPNKVIVS